MSKKTKTVIVDIEVEHDNEYTSEEELDDLASSQYNPEAVGKSSYANSQASGSQQGSSRDLGSFSRKKDKDHMASFNKKMTSKLRERLNQSNSKKGGFSIASSPNLRKAPTKDFNKNSMKKSLKITTD